MKNTLDIIRLLFFTGLMTGCFFVTYLPVKALDITQVAPLSGKNYGMTAPPDYLTTSTQNWGGSGQNYTWYAIKYLPLTIYYLCQVDITQRKYGAPVDNLSLEIWKGGETPKAGILHYTSGNVINGADLSTATNRIMSFWFGSSEHSEQTCFAIQPNMIYWFIISRSGGLDSTNGYVMNYLNGTSMFPISEDFTGWSGAPTTMSKDIWIQIYGIMDLALIRQLQNDSSTQEGLLSNISQAIKGTTDGIIDLASGIGTQVYNLFVPDETEWGIIGELYETQQQWFFDKIGWLPMQWIYFMEALDVGTVQSISDIGSMSLSIGSQQIATNLINFTDINSATSGGLDDFFEIVKKIISATFAVVFIAWLIDYMPKLFK